MTKKINKEQIYNLIYLILGSTLIIFMGNAKNIQIATWLTPIFLLRFMRNQKSILKTFYALPFILASSAIYLLKLAPFPPIAPIYVYFLLVLFFGLIYVFLPYLMDKIFSKYFPNQYSIFIFPAIVILVEYLLSLSPNGTWLSWSYNLFESKSLIQIASITGIWGITFIVALNASIINYIWEKQFEFNKIKKILIPYIAVILIILFLGGLRFSVFTPKASTVKIGSVSVAWPDDLNFWHYINESAPKEKSDMYKKEFKKIEDKLFNHSQNLISSGIKFLLWSVGNPTVFEDQKEELISRAKKFAKTNDIYFFLPMLVAYYGKNECDNIIITINPEGHIVNEYYKAHGTFEEPLKNNSKELPILKTPYGIISNAICLDMDFPDYIKQAGKNNVDILLVPADEPSTECVPTHTKMAMFRGIENGCSVLRQTLEGVSMACDYQGRVLGQMNYYTTKDKTMIINIPTKGVKTVYPFIGDLFVYLCILFLIGTMISKIYDRK